MKAYGEVKV